MINDKPKILIITTIPLTLIFFRGQISFLKSYFEVELVSSSGEMLDEISSSENVKSHIVEINREISFFNDIKSFFKLIILFKKIKPQIIHSNTPKASLLSIIAGFFANVPTRIYYVHGFKFHGFSGIKRLLFILFEKITCFFATDIVAVSQGVKKELNGFIKDKNKISIINNGSINGIDLSYYSTNNPEIESLKSFYNISENDFVYGFIGRLVIDKGTRELLKAFVKISNCQKNVKLLIVGMFDDGNDDFKNEINNIILNNNNIIFVGFQNDVRPFYKMMNALVFPSYREGFGMVVLESSAMNVPVISSDIIGCNEIIVNNETGILVPVKSIDKLFQAMLLIKSDREFYKKLKNNCREYVSSKYEQKALWKKTIEYLKGVYQRNTTS